jgi:4-hydroxyphenylacetate 3-monooxygenase
MLKTGAEHLASLRDGRAVFIADERVADVTAHPAFREAAAMYAALYDMKADPAHRELLSYDEDGERVSLYFLRPRTREDLVRRTAAHRKIADFSYGLLGRSPDVVASTITGLSMKPEVLDAGGRGAGGAGYGANLLAYHALMKRRDLYTCYAVLPPQGGRDPTLFGANQRRTQTLRVTAEDADGVTLNGMKLLATGAVFANEVLVGNILPLDASQVKESITCAIPMNQPGLMLWAREPYARGVRAEFDSPLSYRFDETDSMLLFQDVKVPWERVFVHDNAELSRAIYVRTPAHCMHNHQSNVRFWSKLRLLVGIASLVAKSNGARDIPAVRDTLGRLAGYEAGYAAMIAGQHQQFETLEHGYVLFNRRFMYAAVLWALEHHSAICDTIRELMGGGALQMPASIAVMRDPALRQLFEDYWTTPAESAVARMKLFRLAWDLIGSEFASRHVQYEKFYVGAPFVSRSYNFVNAPWDELHGIVEGLMDSYDLPEDLR